MRTRREGSNGRSQVLAVLSADQEWVSNGRSQVLGVVSADQEWVSNGRSQVLAVLRHHAITKRRRTG